MTAEIRWISFDDTLPVPVLSPPFALSRESILTLFAGNDGHNVLTWNEQGVSIRYIEDDEADAEQMNRIEIDGVELYSFTSAPYQWNEDTEEMADLGYTAEWVPGTGIVVTAPDTSPEDAARRIIQGLQADFGRFVPNRANSWTEYFNSLYTPERTFVMVGLQMEDTEKQEAVAVLVDEFLRNRAAALPIGDSIRADELTVGQRLDARTLRWGYFTPRPEKHRVDSVRIEGDEVVVEASHSLFESVTLRVRADRRFDTA